MLQGETILCISSIDWDFNWQGHQQIMSTLAARGNRVLFIENTGVRRPTLRDMSRLRRRLRNWWRGTKGIRQEGENLFIFSPLVMPFPYSRMARWINRAIIVRAVQRWMKAMRLERPLVWTFLPTGLALDLIRKMDPELVVYYCIDDFAASSPAASAIRGTEHRLFEQADLVFVTSERLRQRVREFRGQVDVFPFAVDFGRFAAVREAIDGMPADMHGLGRPIAGYVGGLHRFIDQTLVAKAARSLRTTQFVFIGPPQCDVSEMAAEPNVHLLGARSHAELPSYIKGFNVGIIPYALDDYTASVYPTKLNEYLAMGIPVVATPLPEVMMFNERHDRVIAVADGPEQFVARIRVAVEEHDVRRVQERIAVARENSWEARLDGMSRIIDAALAERRARPAKWEATFLRLYRAGRRRFAGAAAIATALYLLLFHTPVVWAVAVPLRVAESPRTADAIVVFAGGVGESGTAGGGYQERVRHAVELYRAGYAPRLVFSSGFVFAFREAEIMRSLAVDLGVPADAIVLERSASSTLENVAYVRDILREEGAQTILLVSSPYHMRRAILTWRKQSPDIEVTPTPVPESQYYMHGNGATLDHIRGIAWEYAGLLAYWWRGWL
jgi:uncharacterized SAM-binding protein YcdF (DUF218 family)/glycosyltransferase involved in cell wall biosynthesis